MLASSLCVFSEDDEPWIPPAQIGKFELRNDSVETRTIGRRAASLSERIGEVSIAPPGQDFGNSRVRKSEEWRPQEVAPVAIRDRPPPISNTVLPILRNSNGSFRRRGIDVSKLELSRSWKILRLSNCRIEGFRGWRVLLRRHVKIRDGKTASERRIIFRVSSYWPFELISLNFETLRSGEKSRPVPASGWRGRRQGRATGREGGDLTDRSAPILSLPRT